MSAKSNSNSKAQSSATIGFEANLWLAADKLRNNMDAAEYKHVVLGLIFLKYISDTAGKCQMSKSEVRTRNAQLIRHLKFIIRHSPPPTVGVSNAEVRMANRSRYTSTFEIRQSKFA